MSTLPAIARTKLPAKAAARLLDATAFMNWKYGLAFNGMITFNFEQAGLQSLQERSNALTKLNEAIATRIQRLGVKHWFPPEEAHHCFIYVHETVKSHGHHVHELLTVPRCLQPDFGDWLSKWAMRAFGANVDQRVIHFQGRTPQGSTARANLQAKLVKYVLKSAEDALVRGNDGAGTRLHSILNIRGSNRNYAADIPRIAGASQNLTHRAWMESGYQPPASVEGAFGEGGLRCYNDRIADERTARLLRNLAL